MLAFAFEHTPSKKRVRIEGLAIKAQGLRGLKSSKNASSKRKLVFLKGKAKSFFFVKTNSI
jgi:hypothetical protein